MRVLIIKTSSMGDLIHTLPALTDAGRAIPGITFDWVVEENFAEIPAWHPLVDRVIPVALRRWRKNIFSATTRDQWKLFRDRINEVDYDLIIDAQGLIKSAFLARVAKGIRCGLDWRSAREALASLFYQRKVTVFRQQHAILRARSLFAQALGYLVPHSVPDYGIDRERFITKKSAENYLVFLHGTTWATKHWPEQYWIELVKLANRENYLVKLPWGNQEEKARAQRIAKECERVEILPRLNLLGMAEVLAGAKVVVSVDTGLGHLAAALDVPGVSLYGPTNPALTGALGRSQIHLSAKFPCAPCFNRECTFRQTTPLFPPCFETVSPGLVWKTVLSLF